MKPTLIIVAILAIAFAGACSKKDEGATGAAKEQKKEEDPDRPKTVAGGCDYADTGICTFNKESDPDLCKSLNGKFIAGECPKANAVPGTCLCKSEYNTEVKTYYTTSTAAYTPETAKQHCTNQQCQWQP